MSITIPPAALEAGARAAYEEHCRKYYPISFIPWEEVDPEYQWEHRHEARAAFLAMLENWPGMDVADEYDLCAIRKGWITLPQEASDE